MMSNLFFNIGTRPALATSITDATGLLAALNAATGGETIYIAGAFGSVTCPQKTYALPVNVVAVGAATFSYLYLKNTTNLNFTGITVNKTSGGYYFSALIDIEGCTNCSIVSSSIYGPSQAEKFYCVSVTTSDGITFDRNTFVDLYRCAIFQNTDNVTISNNDCSNAREGFNFIGVGGCDFADNKLYNFAPYGGDHPDALQGFTLNADRANDQFLIARNVIYDGSVGATQGIFFTETGGSFRNKNFTIEDNFIVNGHAAGIAFYEGGENIVIRRNSLLRPTTYEYQNSISIDVIATGCTVQDNIAYAYNLTGGVGNTGNITITASGGAYPQASVFAAPGSSSDMSGWLALPASVADSVSVGANETLKRFLGV
jgi:hypothetical protein